MSRQKKEKGVCLVPECGRESSSRGMCKACYEYANREIRAGRMTDEYFVEKGWRLPVAQVKIPSPLRLAIKNAEAEARRGPSRPAEVDGVTIDIEAMVSAASI